MSQDPSSLSYNGVLIEWVKVNLKNGLWKDALCAARDVSIAALALIVKLTRMLKFKIPRIMSYRIVCEGLETVEGVMDAIECFHQMTSELTEESIMRGEQAEWVLGE